jgi:hypothetical protein
LVALLVPLCQHAPPPPPPVSNSNAPAAPSPLHTRSTPPPYFLPLRLASYFLPITSPQDENQKRIEDLVKEILGLGCLEGPRADNIFRDGSELVQDGNGH